MKIVFYGRHQIGMLALQHLVALGHEVKVILEDAYVEEIAEHYDLEETTLDEMGEFDLFISFHGKKIVPSQYLRVGKFINFHPCIKRHPGHDPIRRYIDNRDKTASIDSHFMTKEVDKGEIIHSVFFRTPVITEYAQFYNIASPYYIWCLDETLKNFEVKRKQYA